MISSSAVFPVWRSVSSLGFPVWLRGSKILRWRWSYPTFTYRNNEWPDQFSIMNLHKPCQNNMYRAGFYYCSVLLYQIEFNPSTTAIRIRLFKIIIVKLQLFSRYLVQYFRRIFNFLGRLNKLFTLNFIQIPLYVISLKKIDSLFDHLTVAWLF